MKLMLPGGEFVPTVEQWSPMPPERLEEAVQLGGVGCGCGCGGGGKGCGAGPGPGLGEGESFGEFLSACPLWAWALLGVGLSLVLHSGSGRNSR